MNPVQYKIMEINEPNTSNVATKRSSEEMMDDAESDSSPTKTAKTDVDGTKSRTTRRQNRFAKVTLHQNDNSVAENTNQLISK